MATIRADIAEIREHIKVLNDDYTKLVERIAKIEVEVTWIKWLSLLIAAGVVMTVVDLWMH